MDINQFPSQFAWRMVFYIASTYLSLVNNNSIKNSGIDNIIGFICVFTFLASIGLIQKYTDEKPRKPNYIEGRIFPCESNNRIVLYLTDGEKCVLELAKSMRWIVIILGMTYWVIKNNALNGSRNCADK